MVLRWIQLYDWSAGYPLERYEITNFQNRRVIEWPCYAIHRLEHKTKEIAHQVAWGWCLRVENDWQARHRYCWLVWWYHSGLEGIRDSSKPQLNGNLRTQWLWWQWNIKLRFYHIILCLNDQKECVKIRFETELNPIFSPLKIFRPLNKTWFWHNFELLENFTNW